MYVKRRVKASETGHFSLHIRVIRSGGGGIWTGHMTRGREEKCVQNSG